MAYLSLYRKYRSQSFDELSGQDHVTRTLQNAIRSERIAHAYVFCGPRGTGKTSTARLLAKALNCEQGPTPEPCGVCSGCVQITEGSHLDVKEIDAASNRGIEDIRTLRDNVVYTPAQGRYKIYVIDEAHQLTNDAFNALLKTLEEPPPHVIFVLATTEAHKLPATIVSRCQRFDFRRASVELLRERIAYVAEQEGAVIEPAAIDLIAREANGGWRDALSLLEQVLAFCDKAITAKDVYGVLGTVEADTLYELGKTIHAAEGRVWTMLEALINEGKDPRQLLADVTQHFRTLMLTAAGSPPAVAPDEAQRITAQAKAYGLPRLTAALELLAQTDREARWSEQPRMLLEVAVIRLMHPRQAAAPAAQPSVQERAPVAKPAPRPEPSPQNWGARGAARSEPSPFVDEATPLTPSPPHPITPSPLPPPPLTVGDARAGVEEDEDLSALFDGPPPAEAEPVARRRPAPGTKPEAVTPAPPPEPAAPAVEGGALDVGLLRAKWPLISQELIRMSKRMVHVVLTDSKPARAEGDTLVVLIPSKTNAELFNQRAKDFQEPLVQAIRSVTGVTCRVRAEAGAGQPSATAPTKPAPKSASARTAPAVAAPEVKPAALSFESRPGPPPATPNGAGGTELVHNVLEVFEGRIVDDPEA